MISFARVGLVALVLMTALSCGMAASYAAPSIRQTGQTSKVQCYEFDVTNDEKERSITDIHFALSKQRPSNFEAPANWGWSIDANGDLTFQTPAPSPPAGTTVGKNPVDPGKTLKGFRFCLPKLDPNVTISISYNKGARSTAVAFQGKEVGSTIVHNAALYCATLRVSAPAEQDVWDIHLGKSKDAMFDPGIDSISAPDGWTVNVGPKETTLEVGKGGKPIKAGTTLDLDICTRLASARLDWKFTDKDHKDIPGASGSTQLKAP